MKIRNQAAIRVLAFLTALILRIWLSTLRLRMVAADGKQHPTDPRREQFIYAFWHEALLAPARARAPVQVLISQHRDGEFIAQICGYLGIGVVRGSTTRGGAQALLEMVRFNAGSHLAITPDGPRGPRREVQIGTVFLASLLGIPIVPIGVGFGWAWRASSWDRFAIPIPFTTIYGVLGEPVVVPPDADRATLDQFRSVVEHRMLDATERAERWSSSPSSSIGPPPCNVLSPGP